MDFNDDIPAVDEVTVRRFIEIIHTHAARTIDGADRAGVLQLCRINPLDEGNVVPSRFRIGDIEAMTKVAIDDAKAGHNVYIEARTVQPGLRGKQRGTLEETAWVFGFVIDSDADKGRAGNVTAEPTLEVETSPGNSHLWYLLDQAIPAAQAKPLGEAIRQSSGADQDTGVITQCYRVAGTPNFPSTAKRARGRCTVEATRIIGQPNRLWGLDGLAEAFPVHTGKHAGDGASVRAGGNGDETTLPNDLLQLIRNGVAGIEDRSAVFHSVVAQLKRRRWSAEVIATLFEHYPNGIARKYARPHPRGGGAVIRQARDNPVSAVGGEPNDEPDGEPNDEPGGEPDVTSPILPTIRIIAGQLPRVVSETEQALISAGAPIFFRAGTLVRPCIEMATAADGRTTTIASLHPFVVPLLLEWMASAALFERFDGRRKGWTVIDPPREIAEALLAHKGLWKVPHVSGVITTPTLRSNGSLLADKGYDVATGLYLMPQSEGADYAGAQP